MNRFDEREINAVSDVIRSGNLSSFFKSFAGGEQVQAFEKEFAEYVGAKYAITVSNGTVALEIALKALGVGRGDEVITTPLSFAATSTAILAVGATPVFVDIASDLTLNKYRVEDAVTSRTKAIIPVSLLGMPADIPDLKKKPKLLSLKVTFPETIPVIEDSAQALGSVASDGKKVGSRATMSTFSLQETKNISSLGEGGVITTNDSMLADVCRHVRNHGNCYGDQTLYDIVCTNARMCEAQAAFGRVQLQKLDHINNTIKENAKYFMKQVKDLKNVMGVLPDFYKALEIPSGCYSGLWNLPCLLVPFYLHDNINRDHLIGYLKAKGVGEGIPGNNVGYYKQLLYELPILKKYSPGTWRWPFYKSPQCPTAERLIKKIILFDIHRWQDKTLIDRCIEALKEYQK